MTILEAYKLFQEADQERKRLWQKRTDSLILFNQGLPNTFTEDNENWYQSTRIASKREDELCTLLGGNIYKLRDAENEYLVVNNCADYGNEILIKKEIQ